jgi:5-methylcytosine-specific restriction endonuclease McrA
MIGAATRRHVRERAHYRCEYCHMRQDDEPFISYQIEHIIAIQPGGSDDEENLALACSHCNLHK